MMKRIPTTVLAITVGLAAPTTSGCLTKQFPQKSRYLVYAERAETSASLGREVLRVDRVRVASMFERTGFVYRVSDARFEDDFYNEFFVPPATMIQRAVHDWLADSGLFEAVLDGDDRAAADWDLQTRVVDLYGDVRDEAGMRAVMTIEFSLARHAELRPIVELRRHYREVEPFVDEDPALLVEAYRIALGRILTRFESDLRARLD